MEDELPATFVVQQEIVAIQVFDRYLLESIPAGAVIHLSGPVPCHRMMEVLWEGRAYVMFERDLGERAAPLKKQVNEDCFDTNDQREWA